MRTGVNAVFLLGALLSMTASAEAANVPAAVSASNLNNPVIGSVAETPRRWIADTSNGCKVWGAEPIADGVTARWSGGCENGLAQGPGTVRWMSNNKQVAELTGSMEQGKLRGHTTGVEEPGNRFDGMFIDSMPEGEGKASFADGSTYSGMWHRGHQLGYGIMTFPPAHPQYMEMLNDGKGRKTENGIYVLRGWWEGKTFVTPCDSEDECEKAVVALMKRDQAAAAAKAGATVTPPAPAVTVAPAAEPVVAPEVPAPTPAPTIPAVAPAVTVAPAAEPVVAPEVPAPTPAPTIPAVAPAVTVAPAAEPAVAPEVPAATPAIPAVAPAVTLPELPPLEPVTPATQPVPATPAPGAPDVEPAPVPAATAPNPEPPVAMPPISAPATPAAEPGEPLPPAAPDTVPAVVPAPEATMPATTDAGSGVPLFTNG